jgi:putative ABC transport system permease protein
MLANYLKIALRNFLSQRSYSFINVTGLAVGLASSIAIVLYVRNELSYDTFNVHGDQVYRLVLHGRMENHEVNAAMSPSIMGPALSKDLPEVKSYTRMVSTTHFGTPLLRYKEKTFTEDKFLWVDSTFFDVFTCSFVAGDPRTALTQPNTAVITRSTALRYFGLENPIGKVLEGDRNRNYVVTGIVESFPSNAHFHFDILGSLATFEDSRNPFWLSNNDYTYVLLREGTDIDSFRKKLNEEVRKNVSPQLKASLGITYDQFEAAGNEYGYVPQALASIHLHSHLDYEIEPNGDISLVYIFSAIALGILLIACVNFVNLSTARSQRRAKEVCVRKSFGSTRAHLIWQFIAESVLTSTIAVILAVVLVELLLPAFNGLTNKDIHLDLLASVSATSLLLLLALCVGVLSGVYPAFYLSSFQPIQVLKNGTKGDGRKSVLRSSLVILQFVVSIALFISTLVIYRQMKFVQEKDLGFDKEHVVVIKYGEHLGGHVRAFKEAVLRDSRVISVSVSDAVPGDQAGDDAYKLEGAPTERYQPMRTMRSDVDFAQTYGMNMKFGRFFSLEHPTDTLAAVVNEAAANTFGLPDPVGRRIADPSGSPVYDIIGVVEDFNFQSLHEAIRPLVIRSFRPNEYRSYRQFLSVRIAPGDYRQTVDFLNSTWGQFAGGEPFDYSFLDQNLESLYCSEQRTNAITTSCSVLAILIACLGLLGLAAFVTEQRTKEIGIRRVLGASAPEMVGLLSKEFAKWVLIANVIAWPLGYYVMNTWLEKFAYRIELNIWMFIAAGTLALIIALLTVSTYAIKAAAKNPVEALRYE